MSSCDVIGIERTVGDNSNRTTSALQDPECETIGSRPPRLAPRGTQGPPRLPLPRREGRLGAGTEREGFRDLGSLRNLQHSFMPLENSTLQSPSPSFRRIANDIFVGWRRWGGGVDHVFRLNILPLVFPTSLASQPINNLIKKDF